MLLLSSVLLSRPAAAAWQPPVLPVASSRGLAAPMMALGGRANLPPAALEVSNRFKKRYEPKQLEPIWRALRQCYGSEELVLQAVRENPQILNPSYSRPERIQASKACLVEIMGEADTLEVMLKNPAVLQCGSALAGAQASEIKGFATLRFVGNRCALPGRPCLRPCSTGGAYGQGIAPFGRSLPTGRRPKALPPVPTDTATPRLTPRLTHASRLIPQAARLPAIGLVFGLTCYGVAYSNAPSGTTAEADAALAIIKPALGLVFGSLFAATVYGVTTAGRPGKS